MADFLPNSLVELPDELRVRFAKTKSEIEDLGLVLRGSVTERWMRCGKAGCRCQASPPRLHGPYYQWTTKIDGKTKTLQLKAAEVEPFRAYIANGRRLDSLVADWKNLSLEALQLIREKSKR